MKGLSKSIYSEKNRVQKTIKLNGGENIYGCYKWVKSYRHILNFRIGLKAYLTISFTSHLRHTFSPCVFAVRFRRAFLPCVFALQFGHTFTPWICCIHFCCSSLPSVLDIHLHCAFLPCVLAWLIKINWTI